MLYPQEIIEQVLDANNIVDVISGYVKLTKKGSTYFGLCPFHNEKTPSFSVTDNGHKKLFYCFGCHVGGTAITFLMKYDNLTYTEAVKVLAERAGIALPKPDYSRQDAERYKKREQILAVYRQAAIYYYHQLRTPKGAQAYQYLQERQLSDETIRQFGLGYASASGEKLYDHMKSKGFSDEVLKETGLFTIKETGRYDYFWNRVMFPIMDARSRVIAFGGRVMGEGEPKYLNSRESMIFEKRKTLFGLHIAARHRDDEWILCEGYMDVISLHQAGFHNAVASLGTALTSEHAAALRKYTGRVVLSYDSDSAGTHAASRAIPILRGAGLQVRVINLLPYKDPDELIKAEGADSYGQRLREARNSTLFEIDMIARSFDLSDPDGKTGFYNETAKRLSYLDDEIERDNYLQAVSQEFGIDYRMLRDRTIRFALNRGPENPYIVMPAPLSSDGPASVRMRGTSWDQDITPDQDLSRGQADPWLQGAAEGSGPQRRQNAALYEGLVQSMCTVLAEVAEHSGFYQKIQGILSREDFFLQPYDTIASMLFDQADRGQINVAAIIGVLYEEWEQELCAQIFSGENEAMDPDTRKKLLDDSVITIRLRSLERQIEGETDIGRVYELSREKERVAQLRIS